MGTHDPNVPNIPPPPRSPLDAIGQGGIEDPSPPPTPAVQPIIDAPLVPQGQDPQGGDAGLQRRILEFWQQRAQQEQQAALNAFETAVQSDPDKRAEAQRLGAAFGLPTDTAERNPEVLRAMMQRRALQERDLWRSSPNLAARLRDLEFARVTHDEIDRWSWWERMVGNFKAGDLTNERGALYSKVGRGEATPYDFERLKWVDNMLNHVLPQADGPFTQGSRLIGQMLFPTIEAIGAGVVGGTTLATGATLMGNALPPLAVLPEEIATVPAAFATGFFGAATAKMAQQSFQVERGNALGDMLALGYDPETSNAVSIGVGVFNMLAELGGTAVLTKPLREMANEFVRKEVTHALVQETYGKAALKFALHVGEGTVAESFEEFVQELANAAGEQIAYDLTDKEAAKKRRGGEELAVPDWQQGKAFQRALEVAKEVAQGMLVVGGAVPGVRLVHEAKRIRAGDQRAAVLEAMTKNVTETKGRERAPETYVDFLRSTAAGSTADTIYVNGQELQEVLQQHGISREELDKRLPEVGAQIDRAVQNGDDVAIPIETWASKIVKTPLEAALADKISIDPDGPTIARVQLEKEMHKAEVERVQKQFEDDKAWMQELHDIEDAFIQQTREAQKDSPKRSEANLALEAKLFREFVLVEAARHNLSPKQFIAENQLAVLGPQAERAEALRQDQLRAWPKIAEALDRYDAGDAEIASVDDLIDHVEELVEQDEAPPELGDLIAELRGLEREDREEHGMRSGLPSDFIDDRLMPAIMRFADQEQRQGAPAPAPRFQNPLDIDLGGRDIGTVDRNHAIELREPVKRGRLLRLATPAELSQFMAKYGYDVAVIRNTAHGTLHYTLRGDLAKAGPKAFSAEIMERPAEPFTPETLQQAQSTRVPTAKRGPIGDPLLDHLVVDHTLFLQAEKQAATNAAIVSKYDGLPPLKGKGARDPKNVLEHYIRFATGNLLWLWDQLPADVRRRAMEWYDGAAAITSAWATRYGVSRMQVAAALAVLSPQNDWLMNVSQGERILDMVFGRRDQRWSERQQAFADQAVGALEVTRTIAQSKVEHASGSEAGNLRKQIRNATESIAAFARAQGRTLGELLAAGDTAAAARWVRSRDETHNDRGYRSIDPAGGTLGYVLRQDGERATMMWKTYDSIERALSVLVDGSAENVHYQLGSNHKVRSFYNNIFDPASAAYLTIDTHAKAALLLLPIASSDNEYNHTQGGVAGHAATGMAGLYPFEQEAYRRAAAERGVLPRQMQSVAWEAVRALFPADAKNQALLARTRDLWRGYRRGTATLEQVRGELGAIGTPEWANSPRTTEIGPTYETGEQPFVAQPAKSPARRQVAFEVAPNPDDTVRAAMWANLTLEGQRAVTDKVAQKVVADVFRETNTSGALSVRAGGWMGQTNFAMVLQLDQPQLLPLVGRMLGVALQQQGMVLISDTAVPGLNETAVVDIVVPAGFSLEQAAELYDELWREARVDPETPLVVGHSTANGRMAILHDASQTGLSDDQFEQLIDDVVGDRYTVKGGRVWAAFQNKGQDYDYADEAAAGRGTEAQAAPAEGAAAAGPSVPRRLDRIRREAQRLWDTEVAAELASEAVAYPGFVAEPGPDAVRDAGGESAPAGPAESGRLPTAGRAAAAVNRAPGVYARRTVLTEDRRRTIGVSKVDNIEQAALALAHLPKLAVEHLDVLVTDKDGKPLALIGGFKGGRASTPVVVPTILGEAFRVPGAAGVWVAHNHPSGSSDLSREDHAVAEHMYEAFRGSGIELRGFMAIAAQRNGRHEFSAWRMAARQGLPEAATAPMEVPTVELQLTDNGEGLGPAINNQADARAAARSIAGGEPGVLLLDTTHVPVAFYPLDPKVAGQLRKKSRLDPLYRAISISNASRAVINNPGGAYGKSLSNIAGALNIAGAEVLDAVDTVNNTAESENPRQENDLATRTFAQEPPPRGEQGGEAQAGEPQGPRGEYVPRPPAGQPKAIRLTKDADASTMVHELAHWFLDTKMAMALRAQQNPDKMVSARVREDTQAILDWFGVGSLETWQAMPVSQQAKFHERFAYSFELYLWEGQAPTEGMARVFATLARWMRRVYTAIKFELGEVYREKFGEDLPELTPEVRQVFDRMLASSQAIEHTKAVRNLVAAFQTREQANMSEEEWQKYQNDLQEQDDQAIAKLTTRSLATMRYLSNAKSKQLRALQNKEKEARDRIRAQVEEQLAKEPVYRAIEYLKTNRLDEAAVGSLGKRWSGGEAKLARLMKQGGINPDAAALELGFASGDEMLSAIMAAPEFDEAVTKAVDARMVAEHSDLTDPGKVADAVEAAVHNAARTRVLAAEMRALSGNLKPANDYTQAARVAAQQILATTPVRHITSRRFSIAEQRANQALQEAIQKGDTAAALRAMRQQMVQHHLAVLAGDARLAIAKALVGFRELRKDDEQLAKRRAVDYVNAGRAILGAFGLYGATPPLEFIRMIEAHGDPRLASEIRQIVMEGTQGNTLQDYRDLTFEKFQDMADTVNALWHLSLRSQQITVEGKRMLRQQAVGEMREQIAKIVKMPDDRTSAVQGSERSGMRLAGTMARLKIVEHWARYVDGGKAGVVTRYLVRPLRAAYDDYMLEREQLVKEVHDILAAANLPEVAIAAPELGPNGHTFTSMAELLGAVLHTGNLSNLRKLVLGYQWAEQDANGEYDAGVWWRFFERMLKEEVIKKEHLDLVQRLWDLMETRLKDRAQKTNHDLYGLYAEEIEATPLQTPWGIYRGGYAPATPDPSHPKNARIRQRSGLSGLEEMEQQARGSVGTPRGFLMKRLAVELPLLLDLRLVTQHIDEALRFIHLQPRLKDAVAIVRDREFSSFLNAVDPTAINHMLIPWLEGYATNRMTAPSDYPLVDRMLGALRRTVGLDFMFGSVRNALQQLTGLSNSHNYVKGSFLRQAGVRILQERGVADSVMAKSKFMLLRRQSQLGQLQDDIDLMLDPSWMGDVKRWTNKHGYFAQRFVQNVVDLTTWVGAYDQSIASGMDEAAAVAEADSVVRLSQGSQTPVDVAAYQKSGALARLFTQFSGYFNVIANQIAFAPDGERAATAMRSLIWPALMAATIAAILSGGRELRDKDDDGYTDEFVAWLLATQIRAVSGLVPAIGPIVGSGLAATITGVDRPGDRIAPAPAWSTLQRAWNVLPALAASMFTDREYTRRDFRDLASTLAVATGVPIGPPAWLLSFAFPEQQIR